MINVYKKPLKYPDLTVQERLLIETPDLPPENIVYDVLSFNADPDTKLKYYQKQYGGTNAQIILKTIQQDMGDNFELGNLKNDLIDVMQIKDYISGLISNLSSMNMNQIFDNVQMIAFMLMKKNLFPNFSGLMGDVINSVVLMGSGFPKLLKTSFDWIKGNIGDLIKELLFPITSVMALGNKAWDKISNVFEDIGEWLTGTWDSVKDTVTEGASDAWDTIKDGAKSVGGAISDAASVVSDWF